MLALLLALPLFQSAAPPPFRLPPAALHQSAGTLRLRTASASAIIDWDTPARTLSLRWKRGTGSPAHVRSFEHIVPVGFWPSAVAGLGAGQLAVAGGDGRRVRVELWEVRDLGEATFEVSQRRCVWESYDDDSIALIVWNPLPPAGAQVSLRVLWHEQRELGRLDIDASGWANYTLEAAANAPAPTGVLHVPQLAGVLTTSLIGEHADHGLVLLLQTPCPPATWCCHGPEVSLALIDSDQDGRLDDARHLVGEAWNTGRWGDLDAYTRLYE